MLTREALMDYLVLVEEQDGSYPQEAMMGVFKYGDIETLPIKVIVDLFFKLKISEGYYDKSGGFSGYKESQMTEDLIQELGEKKYTSRLKDLFIPLLRRTGKHLATSYTELDSDRISQVMLISVWKHIQDDYEGVMLYYGFDYSFHPGFTSGKSIVRREFSKAVIKQFPPDKKEEYIADWNSKGFGLTP